MLTVTFTTEGSCQATSQASRTMSLPTWQKGNSQVKVCGDTTAGPRRLLIT